MSYPQRAHEFICKIGADRAEDLAWELRQFADRIERGDITHGTIGGALVGSNYSYRNDPTMTHERYFQELNAQLEADRASTPTDSLPKAGEV